MVITFKTGINRTKLVIALTLMCFMFGFSARAQTKPEAPLDEDGVTTLLDELKDGLPNLIDDEAQVTAITGKWDAREDLAGKARTQILKLLFADVKSIIKDKRTQDSVWQDWVGEEKSGEETPVASSQKPVTPPVNAPEKVSTTDCPIRVGGRQIGTVKWFDSQKGYGFINTADGKEAFVHYSSIESEGYKTLNEGQKVEFTLCISPGPNPKPRAINVAASPSAN